MEIEEPDFQVLSGPHRQQLGADSLQTGEEMPDGDCSLHGRRKRSVELGIKICFTFKFA